ncbi:hypothetical protein Pint_10374 [Pistacia integerrima]|uniref:Uncharacterized protein n=1 Tax=Pistacia integerrima TaxID=434235 RepID=A0ACC0XIP9_9ROSI|nr:hypothetical protein Pint_10374 [Pistacia integerrima]
MGVVYRFITTPLTTGRLPSQHFDLALPKLFWFTPTFPTCPTVVERFGYQTDLSEGNFNVVDFPLLQSGLATTPIALANCPPFPSVIFGLNPFKTIRFLDDPSRRRGF